MSLTRLFAPRAVALVGASANKSRYGGRAFDYALAAGFGGAVYPVNPRYEAIDGRVCYPDLAAIPDDAAVDVVVAMVAPERMMGVYEQAAARGAGFLICMGDLVDPTANSGAAARAAQSDFYRAQIAAGGPRIVGPQCMGLISPASSLALSTSSALPPGPPRKGHLGLISQSGGIMGGILDRARIAGVGFSHLLSCGEGFDLGVCDFLEFMVADAATRAVALYAEWIEDYPRFFALADQARDAGKPILLLKPGFSEAGAKAALSHTGRIAGNRAIQESAFARHGVIMVEDIDDLWFAGDLLGRAGAPGTIGSGAPGRVPPGATTPAAGVGAVTLSGGYAVVIGDLMARAGLPLAELSAATKARLIEEAGQPHPANPVDAGVRPNAGREVDDLIAALTALHDAPEVGALYYGEMVYLGMEHSVEALAAFARTSKKPFVAAWQGGAVVRPVHAALAEAGMAVTDDPRLAMRTLAHLFRWRNLRAADSLPAGRDIELDLAGFAPGLMAEADALALLARARIPLVAQAEAGAADGLAPELTAAAEALGWPVVLKGVVPGVAHRTERGLVAVGLADAAALSGAARAMASANPDLTGYRLQAMVTDGTELLAGVLRDPHLGPAVALGWGGVRAEAMGAPVVEIAPLDEGIAQSMIDRLDPHGVLAGWRGRPAADRTAIARLLVALGDLAHGGRERIAEIDLNPVIVTPEGAVAVDAVVVLG
jgi:acyl-CoA synthetase (NDP forming)